MVTHGEIWTPPLSPKDQKKLDRARKKWREAFSKRMIQAIAGMVVLIPTIVTLYQFYQQRIDEYNNRIDQQRQATLQSYLDRMSELVFKYNLRNSNINDPVRVFASAQTLVALENLDPHRKGILVQFLYVSALIRPITNQASSQESPIVDMNSANLDYADLSSMYLVGVNFNHAKLSSANLSSARLLGTHFDRAKLNYININVNTDLITDLTNANLTRAHMSHANLSYADLERADLDHTDLTNANLEDAYLAGANLTGTDLTGANLTNTLGTTPDQLNKAKSLRGTIMPDGVTHP